MRTRQALAFTALLILFPGLCARAQDSAPPSAEEQQARFSERKAHVSELLNNRLADLEKRKACVDAAEDPEALRKCAPPKALRGKPPEPPAEQGAAEEPKKP